MRKQISDDDVARYWDDNADAWVEGLRKNQDFLNAKFNSPEFLRFIGNLQGKKVLDAGCGEGNFSRKMAGRGAHVTGVDLSPKMLAAAQDEEKRAPLGIAYQQGSFSDLSKFEDGKFDMIVSAMAMMDTADFKRATEEFFRILRPGGTFSFNVRHPCFATPGMKIVGSKEAPRQGQIIANYYSENSRVEHWSFTGRSGSSDDKPFAVPRFPHKASDYISGLIKAGFLIKRTEEPRPSEALCQQYPALRFWRDHVAMFFYLLAEKPS